MSGILWLVFITSFVLSNAVNNAGARTVGSTEFDFNHHDPQAAKTQGRCETVTIPMCRDMPYNETFLPNNLGHATQEEAGYEAHQYYALVKVLISTISILYLLSKDYCHYHRSQVF